VQRDLTSLDAAATVPMLIGAGIMIYLRWQYYRTSAPIRAQTVAGL
jgi:hypothetical protein